MMYIDKQEFNKKCEDIIQDVKKQEITAPAWAWLGVGALVGLVASCVKSKRSTSKPILINYTRIKNDKDIKSEEK